MHVCTCLVQACRTTETKRESTTSTVASSLATYFGCFACVREKGESARSSENLLVLTCVCLQVYSSASPFTLGPHA